MDSYGKKCNTRFLLNYGFIVEDNDANEFPFMLKLDRSDPLFQEKFDRLGDAIIVVRVQEGVDTENFKEMCAYLRFILLDEPGILASIEAAPRNCPPISLTNELKVLQYIKGSALEALSKYMTSYDQDQAALSATNLTENQRNCIKICMCEKKILDYYLNYLSDLTQELSSATPNLEEYPSTYTSQVLIPLTNS